VSTEKKMSFKQKQHLEREKLILAQAEKIFVEKGYYHSNMEEIAEQVGIAKGTLYLHFSKKEELFYALVEPKLVAFLQALEEINGLDIPGDEKIKRIIEEEISGAFFQFIMKSNPDMAAVFQGDRERKIQHILSQIMQVLSDIIEQGKNEGTFDHHIPTPLMANMFMNLFDPHVYKLTVESGTVSESEYILYLKRIFLHGITAV